MSEFISLNVRECLNDCFWYYRKIIIQLVFVCIFVGKTEWFILLFFFFVSLLLDSERNNGCKKHRERRYIECWTCDLAHSQKELIENCGTHRKLMHWFLLYSCAGLGYNCDCILDTESCYDSIIFLENLNCSNDKVREFSHHFNYN